jgi:hypothetical protein
MRYDHVKSDGRTVSFDTVTGAQIKKYEITLCNRAGEIDRQVIDVPDNTEPWQLTHYVCEALKCWALADGDVIRILAVRP